MSDEGMDLTPAEAEALALRIAARRLADVDNWLEWEDYPQVEENAFIRLTHAVEFVSVALERRSGNHDRLLDIDSRLLLERTQ